MKRDNRDSGLLRDALRLSSKTGEFTLASGRKSDWYLDCREVTTTRTGLRLVSEALLERADRLGATVLGGPASAAIASMAGAVALADNSSKLRGFVYTRDKAKEHGTQQQVDGWAVDPVADRLLLVDDVLTSGGSLLKSRDAIVAKFPGIEIIGAWVLVDRAEGGRDVLLHEGINVFAAYTRLDIIPKTK